MDPPATIKTEAAGDYPSSGPAADAANDQKRRRFVWVVVVVDLGQRNKRCHLSGGSRMV